MSLPPFFDEQGLAISIEALYAGGKSYPWREMGIVRLRKKGNVLTKLLAPTYSLVITTKANSSPIAIFETKDSSLKDRIELAINQVGAVLGAKREI